MAPATKGSPVNLSRWLADHDPINVADIIDHFASHLDLAADPWQGFTMPEHMHSWWTSPHHGQRDNSALRKYTRARISDRFGSYTVTALSRSPMRPYDECVMVQCRCGRQRRFFVFNLRLSAKKNPTGECRCRCSGRAPEKQERERD